MGRKGRTERSNNIQPIDDLVVRESEVEFVDDTVHAYRSADEF
jgi:hypothetical protein